jgi:hypothetical protein
MGAKAASAAHFARAAEIRRLEGVLGAIAAEQKTRRERAEEAADVKLRAELQARWLAAGGDLEGFKARYPVLRNKVLEERLLAGDDGAAEAERRARAFRVGPF